MSHTLYNVLLQHDVHHIAIPCHTAPQVQYLLEDASHAQSRIISAGRSAAAGRSSRRALLPEGHDVAPLEAISLPEPQDLLLSNAELQVRRGRRMLCVYVDVPGKH